MARYEIETVHDWNQIWYAIVNAETGEYFGGYDFMGSVTWYYAVCPECYISETDEAEQIIRDLEAAD